MTSKVGFLLVPNFPMLPYAASIEALRAANLLAGEPLYNWTHLTQGGKPVSASNGLGIAPDGGEAEMRGLDMLIVCAGSGTERFGPARTLAAIRAFARGGGRIVGLSGGPFVLARAGVLTGYRCTLHWDHVAAFSEAFPDLHLTGRLYEIDRTRLTCAGGTAALDLMHAVIANDHGPALAARVSDWLLQTAIREGADPQRLDARTRFGTGRTQLQATLARMEATIEAPLPREVLAREVGLSLRQLERLFRAELGAGMAERYLVLRLDRARGLLRQTGMAVTDIAIATGFTDPSHFARRYRARFGRTPRTDRQN